MAENGAVDDQNPPPKVVASQKRVCSVKTVIGFTVLGFLLGSAIVCTIVIPVMWDDEECDAASSDTVESTRLSGTNVCAGKKPTSGFENINCTVAGVVAALEQAGANVTEGYVGSFNTSAKPINTTLFEAGLCPVNVHWHYGAEHLSQGEFDEAGTGPEDSEFDDDKHEDRRLATDEHRMGFRCHHYDTSDSKFTKEYDWKYCKSMRVGETYEVHWPHSAAGACGTLNQYQTPFYDGVFCVDGVLSLTSTAQQIGVQAQIFTVVNDEDYYYSDLMRGMIVEGDYGAAITKYTGSTTGTTRSNTICSKYTPITWQVDRKCHLISASTFDKMCADMLAQRDDMSVDLHPHGSRELVDDSLAANNHDHD